MEYTPTAIWQELEAGERQNDLHATVPDALRERFVGQAWETTTAEALLDLDAEPVWERDATGFTYEFMSWYGPQLIYTTPRARLYSKTISKNDPLYQHVNMASAALNQWIVSTDYLEFADSLWQDFLLNYCACTVAEKPTGFGYETASDGRAWPEVRRSSYRNVWRDPLALTYEECLWWAERTVVDRETLLDHARTDEEGGWNFDLLEGLPRGGTSDSYRPTTNREHTPGRNEVELIEVWFPGYNLDEQEYRPQDGYHGTLFTLAVVRPAVEMADSSVGPAAVFARQPRPFRGTPRGPIFTQGVYRVTDSPHTLSPLVAIERQRHENAIQVGAALRRMRRRKRLIVTTEDDPEFRRQVESGEEGAVVTLREAGGKSVREAVQEVEIEGLSEQDLACVNFSSDLLRRVAGMGETQAGAAIGNATATEVATASANAGVRAERVKERWRAFHERVLYAVACYIATSGEVEITVNADIARAAGVEVEPGATGVRFKGGDLTWEDMARLSIEVDVTTMERATEAQAQQRMLQAHALILEAIPMIAQVPIPQWWSEHFDRIGDSLNVPHLGEHVAELAKALAAMLAMQMQAGQQAGVQGPAPQAPKPSVSVGFEQRRSTPQFGAGNGAAKPSGPAGGGKALGGFANAGAAKRPGGGA